MRICVLLTILVVVAHAEDRDEAVDAYVRARSGYEDEGFGGPSSVGTQLANDNQQKTAFFRAPGVRVYLPPQIGKGGRLNSFATLLDSEFCNSQILS